MVIALSELELVDIFKNAPWLLPPIAIAWIMQKFQNQRDKDRSETEAAMHAEYREQIRTQNDAHAEHIKQAFAAQQETNEVIRNLTAEVSKLTDRNHGNR